MNDKQLAAAVRAMGLTYGKRDGEYRIAHPSKGKYNGGAYYTTDRDDALATARHMAGAEVRALLRGD